MAKTTETAGPGGPHLPPMKKGLSHFLKEVGIEMRRVIWPTRAETIRLTSAVLFVCVLFVLYLYAGGFLVEAAVKFLEGSKKV